MLRRIIGKHRPSPALFVASLALILAMAGVGVAAIPDSGGTIHACYAKNPPLLGLVGPAQGDLRVIDNAKGQACASSETPLDISQHGPAGPPGAVGATGPAGTTGPQGPAGTEGARAYVSVDAAGNIIAGRVRNVISVVRDDTGLYCVTLSPSVPLDSASPVAGINLDNFSDVAGIVANAGSSDCPAGIGVQINVAITTTTGQPVATHPQDAPFSLMVP